MGQIIGSAAKPKRCNIKNLSSLGTPAAGEHILVSSDNSMNAAGQGNFDCYIVGDGTKAATALPLIKTYANNVDDEPTAGSDNLVKSGGVEKYLAHNETTVSNPEYTEGARKIDGTIVTSSTTYGYTGSIELKDGETIFLNLGNAMYHGGDVVELSELDGNGTWVRGLIQGSNYQTKKEQYTNTSGSTIYVSISGYKTQLGYIIKNIAEAATKEDVDSLFSRTDILSEGVDSVPTLNSEKLVKSGGVYVGLESKVDYNVIDGVANPYTTINTKYIRYSDGWAVTSYAAAEVTIYLFKADYIKHLRCYLGFDGDTPAAIAFYSSDTIDTTSPIIGTYMKSVSVEASTGNNWYETDVPDGAKWAAVTNRGASLANPQIIITSIPFEKVGSIDTYNRKKIYERNEAAVSSAIQYVLDITNLPVGTQLEVDVKEYAGSTPPRIFLRKDGISKTIIIVSSVGKYYIEVDGKADNILFRKEAAENNIYNFTVSSVKEYLVCNRVQPNYTPSVDSFNIGELFQGYYNNSSSDPENNVTLSSSWVSYPLQKSNGYVIHISCSDWASYYVIVNFWNTALNNYSEYNITSEGDVSIECCGAWNVAFRRKNYSALTPSDAASIVIVTRSVSGYLLERPLTQKDGAKINSDISVAAEIAAKGAVIAKEGYGFNPFIEKPFYYHFAANGFIRVRETLDEDPWFVYRNAIASQSLDDVELAARLGFGLIEANIQPTSDGHFVVIHGTSGTFGPECKSINPDVISTADLQATAFNSVTLEWIKTNVRYDSYYEKYQTTLPSLEEFCEACKKHNIGIFAGTSNKDAIDICVKYLSQNVVVYNSPTNIRDFFNGWCLIWNNASSTTIEQILAACRQKGAPVMYGLGPNLAAQLYADNNMNTLIDSMHKEGFLIGWTANYDTEENGRKYLKMGMDFTSSGHDVNLFEANYEVFDIDSDNLPTTTGSVSDGTISLTNGQTITCGNTAEIIGKGWLSVRFNGTLTFTFGSLGNTGRTITSDGSEDIVITDYFFRRGSTLTVTAGADTTVTKFLYKTSKC